jgi:hypothetical protein
MPLDWLWTSASVLFPHALVLTRRGGPQHYRSASHLIVDQRALLVTANPNFRNKNVRLQTLVILAGDATLTKFLPSLRAAKLSAARPEAAANSNLPKIT